MVCVRKTVVLKSSFTLGIDNQNQKLIRKKASFGEIRRKSGSVTCIGYKI